MYTITEELKTPCQIDIEITDACNHSCRYCYNYWRHEYEKSTNVRMTKEILDQIIDEIIDNNVFNVVLTGGEPFTNYGVLVHGVRRLTEAGILVSCNSNLTLATKTQLIELYEAGLPHILTSLASYDPELNDRIFNIRGSFIRIISAIRTAVDIGIKISVNTVISRVNAEHRENIYKTGLLVSALGAKNLFLTRVVPNVLCSNQIADEFVLSSDEYIPILEQALRVKDETGITIGSLIQYPVCFLSDVDRYKDFVGRGCSAGRKMVCISADGKTHACFHEKDDYGNVLEIGLRGVWENMQAWRNNSLIPKACQDCKWFRWCEGGCRVYAENLSSKDFLCKGPDNLPDPVEEHIKYIPLAESATFRVRKGLRFRDENGFWLAHIVGAWITPISPIIAAFLKKFETSGDTFTLNNFPEDQERLAYLIGKKLVEVVDND